MPIVVVGEVQHVVLGRILADRRVGVPEQLERRPKKRHAFRGTLRESGGDAEAVSEAAIRSGTFLLASKSGIDAAPEGGAALEATRQLVAAGRLDAQAEVVVFNTGSGASYRW